MTKKRADHIRYEYGRKKHIKNKKRIGLPGVLVLFMLLGFGFYGVWSKLVPNPFMFVSERTDKIAANIVSQNNTQTQANAEIDVSAVKPKTQNKIKRKNKELIEQLALKSRVYNKAKWSVYVEDIDTGVTAAYNPNSKYSFGEISRVALVPGIEAKISPDRWRGNWFGKTIKDCMLVGLGQSNDMCYEKVSKYVGQPQIQKTLSDAHYDIEVDSNFAATATTEKMATYLADMKRGQVLEAKTRRVVFDALYAQKQQSGLSLGCGDCRVANKQGKSGNAVIDAGIVTHGAKSYVVVIVGENGTFDQITDFAQTIDKYMKP